MHGPLSHFTAVQAGRGSDIGLVAWIDGCALNILKSLLSRASWLGC